MSAAQEITEQIHREVEAWCSANIVGQQATQRTFEGARVEIIRRYARILNVGERRVSLVNYRIEDGRFITWDGVHVD